MKTGGKRMCKQVGDNGENKMSSFRLRSSEAEWPNKYKDTPHPS